MFAPLRGFPTPSSPGLLAVAGGLLLAGLAPVAAEAQAVQLRYQFPDGMDLRYEMVQRSSTSLPGGMGDMVQTLRQELRMQVVERVEPDAALVRSTVEAIRMELVSAMGNQTYDSSEGGTPADPALRPLAAMVGMASEAVLGTDGRVIEAGDLSEVLERMGEEVDPEIAAQLEAFMGAEAVENLFAQNFQAFPADAVSPGESWNHSMSLPAPGLGTLETRFVHTLERVEDRGGVQVAHVAISGTMGGLQPDPDSPMAGMMQFEGGDMSGRMEFDLTNGRILESVVTTLMSMGVMGQTMASETEVTLRLVN
ncbi:MAG: hypothetical protein EA350_15390 [Gemmatimonadales bacterium]|nr:MAG: hypothetical protein EA350_15390 [Gemmatimonadales bacterium]